jgi:hypothetical protein
MLIPDRYDRLFVITSFAIQIVLLVHFVLRKYDFPAAMKYGWIVYALAIPAVIVSIVLISGHKPWYLWVAGFLYAAWALFGYLVDLQLHLQWRSPAVWSILIPYVLLYLASIMFYWWPLGRIDRGLWLAYTGLFALSTYFNFASHGPF